MDYKGWSIEIQDNNDRDYPYIAIAKKGIYTERKRGYSEQQAINLIKGTIDFNEASKKKHDQ